MIKRIQFDPPRLPESATPGDARPLRVTLAKILSDISSHPKHSSVAIEWFRDVEHLTAYRGSTAEESVVVIAEERVMRGEEWLEQRWREGGPRYKQMAIALRAEGLTPGQFSELWRNRAGKVGTTPIPDEAKGLAYVQNHPLPQHGSAYDAVNEVYFEDVDSMLVRMQWLDEAMRTQGEDDLVSANWFLALREDVLA